jgi:hypothetical protein
MRVIVSTPCTSQPCGEIYPSPGRLRSVYRREWRQRRSGQVRSWNQTEFFAVPQYARDTLYPRLPHRGTNSKSLHACASHCHQWSIIAEVPCYLMTPFTGRSFVRSGPSWFLASGIKTYGTGDFCGDYLARSEAGSTSCGLNTSCKGAKSMRRR